MKKKMVYVVVTFLDYEGYSLPHGVFATREAAERFVQDLKYKMQYVIEEHEVQK